jgi:hypothetical protein
MAYYRRIREIIDEDSCDHPSSECCRPSCEQSVVEPADIVINQEDLTETILARMPERVVPLEREIPGRRRGSEQGVSGRPERLHHTQRRCMVSKVELPDGSLLPCRGERDVALTAGEQEDRHVIAVQAVKERLDVLNASLGRNVHGLKLRAGICDSRWGPARDEVTRIEVDRQPVQGLGRPLQLASGFQRITSALYLAILFQSAELHLDSFT